MILDSGFRFLGHPACIYSVTETVDIASRL